jgi:hypothetical protein
VPSFSVTVEAGALGSALVEPWRAPGARAEAAPALSVLTASSNGIIIFLAHGYELHVL